MFTDSFVTDDLVAVSDPNMEVGSWKNTSAQKENILTRFARILNAWCVGPRYACKTGV